MLNSWTFWGRFGGVWEEPVEHFQSVRQSAVPHSHFLSARCLVDSFSLPPRSYLTSPSNIPYASCLPQGKLLLPPTVVARQEGALGVLESIDIDILVRACVARRDGGSF